MCPHPFFSAHTHQTQRAQTTPPSSSNTRARGEGPSARGEVDETPRARGTVQSTVESTSSRRIDELAEEELPVEDHELAAESGPPSSPRACGGGARRGGFVLELRSLFLSSRRKMSSSMRPWSEKEKEEEEEERESGVGGGGKVQRRRWFAVGEEEWVECRANEGERER
ncbi:protein CHUP1, chloroplastic [Iris pallida]|uniref:Protein CHUP1, chloroplastic n=1 Tax=Iris pallida TaxID=29817 RepID=A0AAX6GI24_IRIPA|nr:protein CHUP1, chloroplastic [Iris pallida]